VALYKHHVNTHHRATRAKKVKRIGGVLLAVSMIAILGVVADWVNNTYFTDASPVSSSSGSIRSASVNIFRTSFFQFQADKTWREISSTEGGKKFTYRSFDGAIVQHELTIEVDPKTPVVLANEQTTRVLPITINGNLLNTDDQVSEHCNELQPETEDRHQKMVEYKQVSFPCNPDGSAFVVSVGVIDGDTTIPYKSPDGVAHTIRISYRDSTFSPAGRPLDNIINSFQLL